MLIAVKKVVNKKGIVLGIKCKKNDGNYVFIPKKEFNLVKFDNIKISSDYKVLGDIGEEVVDEVTLFHGSKGGIKGNVKWNVSREECDFGKGFYLGESRVQAREVSIDSSNPYLYSYSIILNGLSVYRFTDLEEWALFVGLNRGFIPKRVYKKLDKRAQYISSHDIIYGLIADDRLSTVFPDFMRGMISDKCLIECLKLVKYGNQYVLKNDKACNRLVELSGKPIFGDELKTVRGVKNTTISGIKGEVNKIIKLYRRQGKFVDELLERWK
jgi:hypothetical protein